MFATKKLYVQGEIENQNQDVLQNELPIIKKNLVWWFDLLAVNSIALSTSSNSKT